MNPPKKKSIYCADFEASGSRNLAQDGRVHVYLWALVNIDTKQTWYGCDIQSFLLRVRVLDVRICYFHNLKFDGNFILSYCLEHEIPTTQIVDGKSKAWYELKVGDCKFRDSLKKFPFSLSTLATQVGIEPKKDKPNFDRYFPKNYVPSPKEIEYCIHDAMILARVMEKEIDAGRYRLTASSESYNRAKKLTSRFKTLFPSLNVDVDAFARKSYKGGYCYLNPERQGIDIPDIYVYDVNSLYPYVMRDCPLPIGEPFSDDPRTDQFYIVRYEAEFELNEGYLPTIQMKGSYRYVGRETEYLTESDDITELYMTKQDYELAHEHYDFYNEQILEYQTYNVKTGVFSQIIDDNNAKKEKATEEGDGFTRLISKLDSNMLYGSFGLNPWRWSATPYIDTDGCLAFTSECEEIEHTRYIPYASAVTSWARHITITSAQKNYDAYIYADTDSLHLTRPAEGLNIDKKHLGFWKHEHPPNEECYAWGKYLRQKGYAHADKDKKIYEHYDKYGNFFSELKFSGIPEESKKGFIWENLYEGYELQGKLQAKIVPGGVCLLPTTFTL